MRPTDEREAKDHDASDGRREDLDDRVAKALLRLWTPRYFTPADGPQGQKAL